MPSVFLPIAPLLPLTRIWKCFFIHFLPFLFWFMHCFFVQEFIVVFPFSRLVLSYAPLMLHLHLVLILSSSILENDSIIYFKSTLDFSIKPHFLHFLQTWPWWHKTFFCSLWISCKRMQLHLLFLLWSLSPIALITTNFYDFYASLSTFHTNFILNKQNMTFLAK